MYCRSCGTQNADNATFCSKCGNSLMENPVLSASGDIKKGTCEQLDLISVEIEKLGAFHKIGFYVQGFFILLYFSLYTLLIGPIIVYLWGKRGWPRNSLVKAVLYTYAYVFPILIIIAVFVIIAAVFAVFIFKMGIPCKIV
ncbi:MAG TPA: zinc ribbon domain-containing protein [Candidatus Methanoperedenaceae archaeon]|nr:zinc ribbon domain-containing protein [Candidatus Methanoperedenaceae archaeon]